MPTSQLRSMPKATSCSLILLCKPTSFSMSEQTPSLGPVMVEQSQRPLTSQKQISQTPSSQRSSLGLPTHAPPKQVLAHSLDVHGVPSLRLVAVQLPEALQVPEVQSLPVSQG